MKTYKKNNNNINDYLLSPNNDINKKEQNYFLNKYHKIYGNSFNDIELLDIFAKNNYNDKKIKEDIEALLSIGNVKQYDSYNNYNNYNSYEKNFKNSKSKSRGKRNKYEKRPFQKCIEIPSDYAPPPKKEEEKEDINDEINDKEKDNKKLNSNNIDKKNEINDKLLDYKEMLFRKLKNADYSYKSNKNKKDEINADDYLRNRNEINKKNINLTENNKKIKIENNSPGPECQPYQKSQINKNINKDLKKKYMRDFFGNMKNYTNNIKRKNWEKSPDFNRKDILLDTSPDKVDFYQRKVLTYKKGFENYYSNENNYNLNKKKEYKYLKIENKINDFFISASYDNPQREQYLKIINEKRKQNPDKIIEFLIPQFPSMFPSIQPYQNMYTSYNQYNPYMNMYMMPPPQFSMNNPNQIINNIPVQNNNNYISTEQNNNNNYKKTETPENPNILTQAQIMQQSNNNQINVKINNTPNPNALLLNNNEMNNSKSNKSSENVSSSGNNNIVDANIHL